jgi:hypothetical protein
MCVQRTLCTNWIDGKITERMSLAPVHSDSNSDISDGDLQTYVDLYFYIVSFSLYLIMTDLNSYFCEPISIYG